jgi:hypothetical protein
VSPEEYAKERAAEDELDLREALKKPTREPPAAPHRLSLLQAHRAHPHRRGALARLHRRAALIGKWLVDELFRVDPELAARWWAEYAADRVEQQTHAVREPPDGDGS